MKLYNQPEVIDYKPGYVSGFRYNQGNFQQEIYKAEITESKCAKDRLCASGPYWPHDQVYEKVS